jgi:GR25 family glycosyltransferase involved in LPS biosynthesis
VDKAALAGSPQALPSVRPGELACFLSHLKVMDMAQVIDGDIMVIEDHALFGPNSQQAIRTIIGLSSRAKWDLMATDVCIGNPLQMIQLLALRRKQPDRVESLDLKSFDFGAPPPT